MLQDASAPTFACRFSELPRWLAALTLTVVTLLVSYGLVAKPMQGPRVEAAGDSLVGDDAMYKRITLRVAAGEDYYAVVADEHRRHRYPLRPFVTVRSPALAWSTAAVGGIEIASFVLQALGIAATVLLWAQLSSALVPHRMKMGATLAAALAISIPASQVVSHEAWSGVLIFVGLLARTDRRWIASVIFCLGAALVRELTAPVLVLLLLMAVHERRRIEATAWAISLLCVAAFYAAHAGAVRAVTLPSDLSSASWVARGGWRFVLLCMQDGTLFTVFPPIVTAVAVPFALLGWCGWKHPIGTRAALFLCAYIVAFMVIGRTNNNYWGMLLAPLVPVGLVFAIPSVKVLYRRVVQPGSIAS